MTGHLPRPAEDHGPLSGPGTGHARVPGRPHPPPPEGRTAPGTAPAPGPGPAGRDRYLDLLRALALVRVVCYHTFGWGWLTLLFPSMGVMFALAGSLVARSLERERLTLPVVRRRLRRLLLPLWLYGAGLFCALYAQGWRPGRASDGAGYEWWLRLACWVLPAGTPSLPPYSGDKGGLLEGAWDVQATEPLWYLRAYFWFVLFSPLLLRAYRRLPWVTMLAPLGLTAVVGTGLVTVPGETGEAVKDFAVHGSCWVLGFARHAGLVSRLPGYVVPSVAPVFMAVGLWWASGHLGPNGWDLNGVPLAQALWSFGFCALLLHFSPSWQTLPGPLRRFERPVTLLNSRAVTLYLWHEVALLASVPLIDLLWQIPAVWQSPTASGLLETSYIFLMFVVIWPIAALLTVAVGWVEDVAANQRPRLWPATGPARPPRWRRAPRTG